MLLATLRRSAYFLLCIFFVGNHAPLHGQQQFYREKWIGLHNMAFKDKTETLDYETQSWLVNETTNEKRLSIGLHYRWFHKERTYRQVELFAFDSEKDDVVTQRYSLSNGDFLGPAGYEEQRSTIRLGYRTGRMVPMDDRLTVDLGVGGYPSYQRTESVPYSAASFPKTGTVWGVEVSFYAGLNYRIHKRINIAYHFVPIRMTYTRSRSTLGNPNLSPNQRESGFTQYDVNYWHFLLDVRNITISYVPEVIPKKEKMRG